MTWLPFSSQSKAKLSHQAEAVPFPTHFISTNKYWAAAEEAFRKGNRSWFPCPAEFYTDMLEVVPPTIMDFHPAFGCYFANGEAWTHAAGGAVYLFFKEKPQPACRMATLQEFIAELEAAPEAPALAGS